MLRLRSADSFRRRHQSGRLELARRDGVNAGLLVFNPDDRESGS